MTLVSATGQLNNPQHELYKIWLESVWCHPGVLKAGGSFHSQCHLKILIHLEMEDWIFGFFGYVDCCGAVQCCILGRLKVLWAKTRWPKDRWSISWHRSEVKQNYFSCVGIRICDFLDLWFSEWLVNATVMNIMWVLICLRHSKQLASMRVKDHNKRRRWLSDLRVL